MAISRVIEVSFRGSSVALVRIDTAYFYNNGILFKPTDIDLPASYQVHWADSPQASSTLETIGTAEGAPIPDDLWNRSRVIYGWIYLHPTEDSGVTGYEVRIYKNVRAGLPDGTEPTPEEQSTIDQLIGALNSAVEQTGEDVESAEQAKDDAESARDNAQTYANNAQSSAQASARSAESASESARVATEKATASAESASASAQIKADVESLADDAQGYANSASQSASQASASEQGCARAVLDAASAAAIARARADEASGYAQTASSKASEASQSASQASGYAQTAETAKTDAQTAKTQADTARDEAVTAKTAAETAQGKAEDAQAAAESVAESIPSDYSQLSEDVSDLKEDLSDSFSENIFDHYTPVTGKYYDGTEHAASSYNYYVVPVLKGVKYMVLPKMRMHVIKQGSTTVVTDTTAKKTSFISPVTGVAYITVYAVDTPLMFLTVSDDTLTIVGKSADAKATGSLLIPTHNHVINYNYTVFASDYVEGKYYGTNGSIGTSASYNYYAKIPVVKGNTYHFVGGRGARYAVLYNNNVIVQTAEIATTFTAQYDGELYVTEFASTPLKMYLYNDFYKITEWTNDNVNGYRYSTSDSSDISISSTAGDIMHLKLNGYDGSYFSSFLLYAVVGGNNVIVATLYSDTGEVVFVAPTATQYKWYINRSQTETATFEFELTNYSKKTIFNTLGKLNVSERFKSNIYGKKIACLGDSFTYGVATYVAKMNSRYLSNAKNYGVASSRIVLDATSNGTTIQSFLNRYASMDDDADIITVFGGINDSYDIGAGNLALGTIDSSLDTNTFYGGLKLLVTNLMKKYPDKQIIGIIPPDCQYGQYYIDNLPDVQQAERDVYNMYGIPVIDIKKECYKMSTLAEMVALYRGSSTDIHPSQAGQEALCDTISAGIRRIIS